MNFAYCRTQFALYKNDGSTWRPWKKLMLEDFYKSVDVVARYGQIVLNNHVKPEKQAFEPGGIGSFMRRLPHLQYDCKKIATMYPGLVQVSGENKEHDVKDFYLTFTRRSINTVNKWRKEHGYL